MTGDTVMMPPTFGRQSPLKRGTAVLVASLVEIDRIIPASGEHSQTYHMARPSTPGTLDVTP